MTSDQFPLGKVSSAVQAMSGTSPSTTVVDSAATKAARAYNAAADCYDDPVNAFWNRFGRRTVECFPLAPGMRVLDVCCGSGASAIPAAQQVGIVRAVATKPKNSQSLQA